MTEESKLSSLRASECERGNLFCDSAIFYKVDYHADSANLLAMTNYFDSQNLGGRFCESALFGGLESYGVRGTLLFAKAKSSKNF